MYIKIEIFPTPGMEEHAKFRSEISRAMYNLMDAIAKQCVSSKAYAIGSGSILDREGQILVAYNIQAAKPKDPELPNCRSHG
jgi:hypothetical protein